jgi:hypothetical protein
VNGPFSFLALALLIVEGFITLFALMGGFTSAIKLGLLVTGLVIFVGITGAGIFLAWHRPECLKPNNLSLAERGDE